MHVQLSTLAGSDSFHTYTYTTGRMQCSTPPTQTHASTHQPGTVPPRRALAPLKPHHQPARHGAVTSAAESAASAAAAALAAAALAAVALLAGPGPAVAGGHSWPPCSAGSACVSSNSFLQPAQYLPPWSFVPDTQQTALRSLLDELAARSAEAIEVDEAAGYVSARVVFGPGRQDYDSLQFLVQPDGLVLFKSEAAGNRLYPPFCFTPGCISGPGNRQRLEELRNSLGWVAFETDEGKAWQQILLH